MRSSFKWTLALASALSFALFTSGCELELEDDGDAAMDSGSADTSADAGGDTETDTVEPCDCDRIDGTCETLAQNSAAECACDLDCAGAVTACSADGYCDSYCPEGRDPDCEPETCECDDHSFCEAADNGTTDICECDDDCGSGDEACSDDGRCDSHCPADADPDCGDPECGCDYNDGICEPKEEDSTDACACDEDCDGTTPCKEDGHCDSWCPDGVDPDCAD